MQISDLDSGKIKVTLTNTEVLCCFSSYEKLIEMNGYTKNILKRLLYEITEKHYQNGKIDVKIYIRRNQGCIIILSPTCISINKENLIFEFSDIENLIKAAIFLEQNHNIKISKNSLYKIKNVYHITNEDNENPELIYIMNEFCDKIYKDIIKQQFTYEYGKLLIENNAIKTLADAFKGS